MSLKRKFDLILALLLLSVFMPLSFSAAQDEDAEYEELLALGEKVYSERCLICHGEQGYGKGPAGILRRSELNGRILEIYPRDLAMGVYRFRTTPTGCLPDDQDLLDVVSKGITRSFMPSHEDILSMEEQRAVVEYIKTFSYRFEEEYPCDPIAVEKPSWIGSVDSVAKGEVIYEKMKCGECHGYDGRGDGPKSNDLKDDWGKPILPFNFATGDLKRGSSPENVYITFTTGLDGTGMPSYEDSLNEEDRWHLVSFTLKLMGKLDN